MNDIKARIMKSPIFEPSFKSIIKRYKNNINPNIGNMLLKECYHVLSKMNNKGDIELIGKIQWDFAKELTNALYIALSH